MISQQWFFSNNRSLLGVLRIPKRESKDAVLILPAFSQPMCDVDYFMTRMAKMFAEDQIATLQFDPTGHGDSSNRLVNATVDILKEDINNAINYLRSFGFQNISIITRGIMVNISAGVICEGVNIIGLNPFLIKCCEINELLKRISCCKEKEVFGIIKELNKCDIDESIIISLLESLGIRVRYVSGQIIHSSIWEYLTSNSYFNDIYSCNYNTCLMTLNKHDWEIHDSIKNVFWRLKDYKCCFERNPIWQFKVMQKLLALTKERCKDAVAISDY